MRIESTDLHFWTESIRVKEEKTFSETKESRAGGEGFLDDKVTISSSGHTMSDSSKLNTVLSHAVVHDIDGQETEIGYHHNGSDSLKRDKSPHPPTVEERTADTPQQANISTSSSLTRQLHDEERMAFRATGNIVMADGRQVEFSQEMVMQREFDLLENEVLNIAPAPIRVDPLVINYGGVAPTLSNAKHFFDLDGDGEVEKMPFVGSGSGFLALDINGDGAINDGRELFGPTIGSGFAELRAYDQDLNGWIDENDAGFSRLTVWSKVGPGFDRLQSLKELGIGAISLENTETEFSITNHRNEFQGQVRSSGVILKEDGSVYTIQQVDLGVKKLSQQQLEAIAAQGLQRVTVHDLEQLDRVMRIQAERGDGTLVVKEESGLSLSNPPGPRLG